MRERAWLFEVGPRDGLQGLAPLSVAQRIELIDTLVACGAQDIEVGSLVRADRVPAMADSDRVFQGLPRHDEARYWMLVPNAHGLARAEALGVSEVALLASASEAFSLNNVGLDRQQMLTQLEALLTRARQHGWRVRVYLSCVLACPYSGWVAPAMVVSLVEALLARGCPAISLGDTLGIGAPARWRALLQALRPVIPMQRLALHCHDTYGLGAACVYTGLEFGVRRFDASVAGLGGCPFAPVAAGNLASETLLYLLEQEGFDCGIDLVRWRQQVPALLHRFGLAGRSPLLQATTSSS